MASNSPLYTPNPIAFDPHDSTQVAHWAQNEFQLLSRVLGNLPRVQMGVLNAPPLQPRTAMFAYADGTNWNPGSGEGLYEYKGGLWVPIGVGGGSRTRLLAPTSFFVATNGLDTNDGLTTGTSWLTLPHASSVLGGSYDFGGQAVTLHVAAGTYTGNFSLPSWVGGGTLAIVGTGTPFINTSNNCFDFPGALPGQVSISGFKVASSAGYGISLTAPGVVSYKSMTFGAGNRGVYCGHPGAQILASGSITINGNLQIYLQLSGGNCFHQSVAVTLTGVPAWSIAGFFIFGGNLFIDSCTFAGAATGTRYSIQYNGVIETGNAGPNYLPGNVAGQINPPGYYV